MKQLVKLVRDRLTDRLPYLAGVNILQGEDRFPKTMAWPFLIISEAGDEAGEAAGGRVDTLFVDILIVQKIYSDKTEDKAMMGAGAQKGILDIAEEIKDNLETEEFLEPYHRAMYEGSDPTSYLDLEESEHLQFKLLHFSWRKFTAYQRTS
jgi:hypothetical protein